MAERALLLLRHAKSDWSGGATDFDRPLNDRGLSQAPEIGRWLDRNFGGIDLAVVSPAYRARSTWQLAAAEITSAPGVRFDDALYGASPRQLLDVVRMLPDDAHTVILVAHNPGIEDFVSLLTDESVSMSTSALAVVGLNGSWSTVSPESGELQAFGRPPLDLA